MRTVYYRGLTNSEPLHEQPSQTEDISKFLEDRCKKFGTTLADYYVSETVITEPVTSVANPKQAYGDNKVGVQFVPPALMIAAAEALGPKPGGGATKYGPYNWRDIPVECMTYVGAILRHILAYMDGEDIDPEGNKPHLGGIVANAAILLDAKSAGTLIDNRPSKGTAAARIRELSGVKL